MPDKFFHSLILRFWMLHFIVLSSCCRRCDTHKNDIKKHIEMTKSYEFPSGIEHQKGKLSEREEKKSEQRNQSPRQTTTKLSNGRQLYNITTVQTKHT